MKKNVKSILISLLGTVLLLAIGITVVNFTIQKSVDTTVGKELPMKVEDHSYSWNDTIDKFYCYLSDEGQLIPFESGDSVPSGQTYLDDASCNAILGIAKDNGLITSFEASPFMRTQYKRGEELIHCFSIIYYVPGDYAPQARFKGDMSTDMVSVARIPVLSDCVLNEEKIISEYRRLYESYLNMDFVKSEGSDYQFISNTIEGRIVINFAVEEIPEKSGYNRYFIIYCSVDKNNDIVNLTKK